MLSIMMMMMMLIVNSQLMTACECEFSAKCIHKFKQVYDTKKQQMMIIFLQVFFTSVLKNVRKVEVCSGGGRKGRAVARCLYYLVWLYRCV